MQFAAGISRVKSGYVSSSYLHFDGTQQFTRLFLYLQKWVWLASLSFNRSSYYYGYTGVGYQESGETLSWDTYRDLKESSKRSR